MKWPLRFEREFKALSKIMHPNVLKVTEEVAFTILVPTLQWNFWKADPQRRNRILE